MQIQKKHFSVAIMDQSHQMMVTDEDNKTNFIQHVPEFLSRLIELSENQHIYMDYKTFKALGSTTILNRFCRIFCQNQSQIAEVGFSTFYRVHHISDIQKLLEQTTFYQPDTLIFFMGGEDFLSQTFQYCRKLLLTVVDIKTEVDNNVDVEKFPIHNAIHYFHRRKDMIPELMEPIVEFKKLRKLTKPEQTFEIADNGMKIIKTSEPPKNKYDSIFDAPDYMFYEFTK
jgi:hypothetical protein